MQCLPNNHCSAQSSVRNNRAEKLRRAAGSARSGVAIMWLIAAAPAILIMLCIMVEVGHIWNARVKLEVALEAAALAGVKTWSDLTEADNTPGPHDSPGEFAKTSAARDAAVAAAAANTIAGVSITLDRNENDDGINDVGYDNANCTGDLLLGGFPTTGGTDFNVTSAVGCGRSTMSVVNIAIDFDIEVDTSGGTDTSDTPDAFRISFTSAQPGLSITELQIDLRNNITSIPAWLDNGTWDFGTLNNFALGSEAAGRGPATHASSNVTILTATGDGTGVMTLTFAAGDWLTGETLVFGVDTDNVESTGGLAADTVADEGGDFGDTPGANGMDGRIAFSFGFNGGPSAGNTVDERLQRLGGGTLARLQGNSANFPIVIAIVVPDEDYAVLAQQTLQVNSICSNLFGIPIGPFTISGRAVATARCAGANSTIVNNPLLVHVTGTTCP
tara:strand:- start:137486 stop:138820 length:1335 start_codon:yes stop_codon:yes gene_type:complete